MVFGNFSIVQKKVRILVPDYIQYGMESRAVGSSFRELKRPNRAGTAEAEVDIAYFGFPRSLIGAFSAPGAVELNRM